MFLFHPISVFFDGLEKQLWKTIRLLNSLHRVPNSVSLIQSRPTALLCTVTHPCQRVYVYNAPYWVTRAGLKDEQRGRYVNRTIMLLSTQRFSGNVHFTPSDTPAICCSYLPAAAAAWEVGMRRIDSSCSGNNGIEQTHGESIDCRSEKMTSLLTMSATPLYSPSVSRAEEIGWSKVCFITGQVSSWLIVHARPLNQLGYYNTTTMITAHRIESSESEARHVLCLVHWRHTPSAWNNGTHHRIIKLLRNNRFVQHEVGCKKHAIIIALLHTII